MNVANNNQSAEWTADQFEQFMARLKRKISSECNLMIRTYGADLDREDVASEIGVRFWQQVGVKDPNGPFAKNSPQQAADFFLRKDNFQIREWARSVVRKDNKWKLRQAEAFDDVRLVDPRQDIVTNVVEVVRGLPGIASAPGSLTPNEQEGFVLETARRLLDDYPQDVRDQVARSGGISISKLRAHTKDYDEAGHSSAKDRQTYSRACRKIAKAFTPAALLSLLMDVLAFALSLSLFIAIQPGRALQQYDFVNQGCFDHQNDLAHQGNFIDLDPLAHQDT